MHTGPLLNHAARVKQHAAGGQVLVDSQSCAQVTDLSLRAVFIGSHKFKGMKESLDIYQMTQEVRSIVRQINVGCQHSISCGKVSLFGWNAMT